MSMSRIGIVVMAWGILLVGGLALAQETVNETDEDGVSEPSQTRPAATAPQAADSAGDTGGKQAGDDPFDYEASEQISEDLSVSFPVDI
jgi:hypothetical protein